MSQTPTYKQLERRVKELEKESQELKQKEASLKEDRERFRTIFESTNDCIFLKDSELRYISVNPAMELLFGTPAKRLLGCTDAELFGKKAAVRIEQLDARVLKGESLEEEDTKPVGSVLHTFHVRKSPVRDTNGKVVGICGIARDITESKRSQEELAQIFSMSLDMICIADINTATFLKVNPAFTDILGFTEEELLQKPFLDFVHPDDVDSTRSIIEHELWLGKKVIDFENRYRCKDGTYRWLSWVSHPNPEKGITYSVARDMTDKIEAERLLIKSEQELRRTLDATTDGIWTWDFKTNELFFSPTYYKMLGYEPNAFPANYDNWLDLIHPDDRQRAAAVATEYLETKPDLYENEFRLRTQKGDYRWIHARGRVVDRDEKGDALYMIGNHEDITERKLAQEEILKVKRLLDATGRMARVGGWEVDTETLEVTWTDETYRIHEVPLGHKLRLQEAIDYFHPEDRGRLSKAIQRALDHGEPYDMEIRFITAKGNHLWTRTICHPQTKNDKVVKLVGTFQDITDRKRAEDALREESVFRKTTISESPVGINIYDVDTGRCIVTNNSMSEFIGGTQDQVLEQNFYEIHSWKVSGLLEMAERALKADKNMHDTVKLTTSFGKEVFLDCYLAPFNVGEKRYLMVTATDVSELLKTQKALKTAHETFLTVLDSIDATIYVADMETHEVLFMNKHMRDSFGQDFTGRICWEVFRGESGPCPHCTNEKLLDKSGDPTGVCIWHDRNPVTGKWYINYDRAIEWTDGRMVRIQIATDITDLKKMEAELRQAYKMEAIGTLAGGIAHDFNNVLGIILGNIEMASTDIPAGNPAHSNLGEALKGCFRARDMVRQILAFSRREEVAFQPVDIQPIVKEALKMLRSSIPTTIDIQQDIVTKKAVVMGDPTQIHQVLMNLCTNAVDAMDEMGSVLQVGLGSVELDADSVKEIPGLEAGRHVRLTVSDTGHGIPPQVLDKIFDPYFTTKDVGKGTGMGLAVAHGIAKEHGGAISVYSEAGKGTTFHVYFPEVQVEENEYWESVEPLPNGTESVLFVDDEESLANLGRRMLGSLGYNVDFRTSAIDALESFRANPDKYDLVVTDMTMPNMTGETLAKELMGLRPDIPIILSTGFSHRMDEKKAKSMGIKGFITKPLVKSELANAVRKVLDEE